MHQNRFPIQFKKLFGFLLLHSAARTTSNDDGAILHDAILDDQHGIAIAVEFVFLLYRNFIRIHDMVISAKCSHHHQ